jgi:hypothetical protein
VKNAGGKGVLGVSEARNSFYSLNNNHLRCSGQPKKARDQTRHAELQENYTQTLQ